MMLQCAVLQDDSLSDDRILELTEADIVARCSSELRIANDGFAYGLEDFRKWYANEWSSRWEAAARVPLTISPPEGLETGRVSIDVVREVLSEILPQFPCPEQRAKLDHRSAFEVGWTVDHTDYSSALEASPLNAFPSLRKLVQQSMWFLRDDEELLEARLNISCLLYSPGQGIPMHSDRVYVYEEDVYGCIIANSSDRALEFHEPPGTSSRYIIPELPGACFSQRGNARYSCKHGVLPLKFGERLSVTWRWFQPQIQLKSQKA